MSINLNVGSKLMFPGTDEGRDLPEKISAANHQYVIRCRAWCGRYDGTDLCEWWWWWWWVDV